MGTAARRRRRIQWTRRAEGFVIVIIIVRVPRTRNRDFAYEVRVRVRSRQVTGMFMRMCVLGSGSSGNCTVVRVGERALMIDAGLGPRTAGKRLMGTGATVADVGAMLLTHLDGDHFKSTWFPAIHRQSIKVYVHHRHIYALYRTDEVEARRLQRAGLLVEIGDEAFTVEAGGQTLGLVRPVHGPHDVEGVVSYRAATAGGQLMFATDLGRADHDALIEAMTDVDLLAIESNYDPPMQLASSRPPYLKRRIMGGRGHLSNEQAFEAVCRALDRSKRLPSHIVLLHLSRQCNCPNVARALFESHPRVAERLCITNQSEPTPWLHVRRTGELLVGEQMTMFA